MRFAHSREVLGPWQLCKALNELCSVLVHQQAANGTVSCCAQAADGTLLIAVLAFAVCRAPPRAVLWRLKGRPMTSSNRTVQITNRNPTPADRATRLSLLEVDRRTRSQEQDVKADPGSVDADLRVTIL